MNKEQARAIIEAHDICTDEEDEEMQLLAKHNPELLEAYRALARIAFPISRVTHKPKEGE